MTFVDQAVRGVMTGVYAGVGTAGFSEYDYPGLYRYDDSHHCGLTGGTVSVDDDGTATVSVAPMWALAIHVGEKGGG